MLYKNFIRVTIHHVWKAGKLYYDVKKEMESEKEINWYHIKNGSIFKL